MNFQLAFLTLCQGLFLVNNVTFIAINGLVGLSLAPASWMATLPVMGYVVGGALSTVFVGRHHRAWGRKRAFQVGLAVAAVSTALCAYAVLDGQFWLLVFATLLAGYYNANAALYRFAATELVAPPLQEKAISWVLAGGILGAVAGPNLANATRDVLAVPFAGAYVSLIGVALISMIVVSFINFPPLPRPSLERPHRALKEIARNPIFVASVIACSLSYGVMNLLMAATPIAMAQHTHSFTNTALVLEWHVLGMFVPSFFTGSLIKRFGTVPIMAAGVLLYVACIGVALSGVDLMQFLIALFVLGVGWNFLYIGGTTMFTQAYEPEEKTTAQAAMDFCVYTTMAITSFGSGALITTQGWTWLNRGTVVPVCAIAAVLSWLIVRRKRAGPRAA